MFFLPISLALFLLFLLLVPALFVLAPAVAFAKLGFNPVLGYGFFILCLLGGGVNIPVYRKKAGPPLEHRELASIYLRYFGITIPRIKERIIAINLGGFVLPGLLALYLLRYVPAGMALSGTVITSIAAFILSRPVKGVGIVMPPFVPPVISALAAILISREYAPQLAYISGVWGTIIGADLLRLHQFRNLDASFLSIGGAGVFDGIFLVGIVSVLIA